MRAFGAPAFTALSDYSHGIVMPGVLWLSEAEGNKMQRESGSRTFPRVWQSLHGAAPRNPRLWELRYHTRGVSERGRGKQDDSAHLHKHTLSHWFWSMSGTAEMTGENWFEFERAVTAAFHHFKVTYGFLKGVLRCLALKWQFKREMTFQLSSSLALQILSLSCLTSPLGIWDKAAARWRPFGMLISGCMNIRQRHPRLSFLCHPRSLFISFHLPFLLHYYYFSLWRKNTWHTH